jgi:hypothetical protein
MKLSSSFLLARVGKRLLSREAAFPPVYRYSAKMRGGVAAIWRFSGEANAQIARFWWGEKR